MAIIPQSHLFHWQDLDAASDLDRFRLVLLALPDEPLVRSLERRRGHGRDDYPIRPTWNAMIAGIVFQHVSSASLLRELRRNAELRQLCGFAPALGEAATSFTWWSTASTSCPSASRSRQHRTVTARSCSR
ncbi:MAG: transposase [bacterium]|nr:transposase [bacterium]